jgi:CTP:molybdopterin cytidylyltransferase MocA
MGTPKALLDASGETFLARVLQALREGGCHPIFVVVEDVRGPTALAARACGGEPLLNPDASPGPISSLQAGIRGLPDRAPGLVFSPVDHPLFLPSTVGTLIREFAAGCAPALIPTYLSRRGHPVLFRRVLFPELLEKDLPAGARSVVRRYLGTLAEVPVEDPGILADIDTWDEYRRHFP